MIWIWLLRRIDTIGCAWFTLPAPERRLLGRLALAALALAFTRSTLAALCLFYVIDRLVADSR